MKKLSYKTLYIAWAVMFVLTTALGFAFPEVENGWAKFGLGLVAVLFFLPPGLVLSQAKAAGHHHLHILQYHNSEYEWLVRVDLPRRVHNRLR